MQNKHIAYLIVGIMSVSLVAGVSAKGDTYQGRMVAPTTRESVTTPVKQEPTKTAPATRTPVKVEPTKTTAPVKPTAPVKKDAPTPVKAPATK